MIENNYFVNLYTFYSDCFDKDNNQIEIPKGTGFIINGLDGFGYRLSPVSPIAGLVRPITVSPDVLKNGFLTPCIPNHTSVKEER
jgi:hypothetical protein